MTALTEHVHFLKEANASVASELATTTELSTFLRTDGTLSLADRMRIVEQSLVLLKGLYVHRQFKEAMHGVTPVHRLTNLKLDLKKQTEESKPPEIEFHRVMVSIYTSFRDLQTGYLLPSPFREMVAFLPFKIEEFFEEGEAKYIISAEVAGGLEQDDVEESIFEAFIPGAEVLFWNGIPISRAVELNANPLPGANLAARHALGLNTLTIRPMMCILPPEEHWVTIGFRGLSGEDMEIRRKWLVFSPKYDLGGIDPDSAVLESTALSFDLLTDLVFQSKAILYAPAAVKAKRAVVAETDTATVASPTGTNATIMPTIFSASSIRVADGYFGYIRIFSFNVKDTDSFIDEFVRLVQLLPQRGLIVDVRGNGGGLIHAAERLLQTLTPHRIEPEPAQFINTPMALQLCRKHSPSKLCSGFDLSPWVASIEMTEGKGFLHSMGLPITSPESCNSVRQRYFGPVILLTDAVSYGATDIFAAGFRDHDIGPIIGTSENTGAGGANVWTHHLLETIMHGSDSPLESLPNGAGIRIAVRRTLRVGQMAGVPVEDFGVVPDIVHLTTRLDLVDSNIDLINAATERLSYLPATNPIFVCYARSDEEFVLALAGNLQNRGLNIWLDQWKISPGEDWDQSIDHALAKCDKLLIVLSPDAVSSREVRSEYRTALDLGKPILPILYKQCDIPRQLRMTQYVDFTQSVPDELQVVQELIEALKPD